jgi:putative membrane protein
MKKSNVASAILVAVVVSILLATGLVAARQNQDTTQNSNTNTSGGSTSGQTGGGSTLDSSDRKFMMEAGMGGMAEVEWARVALQRASSDGVKQFAQRMIDDHTKAGQELTQLASTKGVTLETALDNKHAGTLTKLQGMSGAEFDRAYLKEAGVKAHEKMEKLYMREADRGKDADAKAFASKTLPTVQEHLRMAREMMTGMSGKNMSGNSNMSGNTNSNSGRTVDSGAGTMGESQGSGVDTNPDKRTTQNSNMSNSNMSNSNMSNSNMAGNSNMSGNSNTMNSNMSNSNMSGNDNTSGNSNMSNDNTMNSNGNSNTGNANGNSNTGNTNGNSNTPR